MKEFYKGLGHVAIHVRSMEESIAFYEKIGGTVLQQDALPSPEGDKLLCLIDLGGADTLRLGLLQQPAILDGAVSRCIRDDGVHTVSLFRHQAMAGLPLRMATLACTLSSTMSDTVWSVCSERRITSLICSISSSLAMAMRSKMACRCFCWACR